VGKELAAEIMTLIETAFRAFNRKDPVSFNGIFGGDVVIIDGFAPFRWIGPNAAGLMPRPGLRLAGYSRSIWLSTAYDTSSSAVPARTRYFLRLLRSRWEQQSKSSDREFSCTHS
jgi:hypothetical protein